MSTRQQRHRRAHSYDDRKRADCSALGLIHHSSMYWDWTWIVCCKYNGTNGVVRNQIVFTMEQQTVLTTKNWIRFWARDLWHASRFWMVDHTGGSKSHCIRFSRVCSTRERHKVTAYTSVCVYMLQLTDTCVASAETSEKKSIPYLPLSL